MTRHARGVGRGGGHDLGVAGLAPLVVERIVRPGVAAGAARRRVAKRQVRQRHVARPVGLGDVVQARPMAALALHVVVRRVGLGQEAGRTDREVAVLVQRVAAVTVARRVARGLQIGPRRGVLRLPPVALVADVAVAARGLPGADGEVAEEAAGGVGRRVEGRAVAVNDAFLSTSSKGQRGQSSEAGQRRAKGRMHVTPAVPMVEFPSSPYGRKDDPGAITRCERPLKVASGN